MRRTSLILPLSLALNVVFLCVLGFYRSTEAQTPANPIQPFANSLQQRMDMVEQLKDNNQLLKEQIDFLRSGQLKVIVVKDNQ